MEWHVLPAHSSLGLGTIRHQILRLSKRQRQWIQEVHIRECASIIFFVATRLNMFKQPDSMQVGWSPLFLVSFNTPPQLTCLY